MFSIFCKNMFRKLLYRPTAQILNYISTPKVAYCRQYVKSIPPSSYRTLSSVAHKYDPPIQESRVDRTVIESIDDALAKIDHNAKFFGRVIELDVKSVFKSIKSNGAVSSIQSLYLIRCCGSLMHDASPAARINLLHEMWNEFQKLAVPMDASHYNSLLKAYIENEHSFVPTDFLSTMEKNGVTPNRVTFQRLIQKYCENGDISGASVILDHMKKEEMAINLGIFNSLIKGHEKTGDLEGSKQMRQVMQQSKLEPNIETYFILAASSAEKGDIDSVFSVIQEAEKNNIYFMITDYLQLVYHSATHGHKDNIDALLSKMTNIERHRTEVSNMVLDLVNKGHEEVAYKLLMLVSETVNFTSGFNLFIKQSVKMGMPIKKVLDYCTEIRNNGIEHYIFQVAAKAALENRDEEYILQLFHRMQKEGIPIRNHYFWPILAVHNNKKDLNAISQTLKAMCDLGVPTDFDTHFDYVLPCLKDRDLDSVIKFIKETGHSEVNAIDALFHFYCHSQDWKNIVKLLERFSVGNHVLKLMAMRYAPGDTSALLQALHCISKNPDYEYSQDVLGEFLLHMQDFNKPIQELLIEAYDTGCMISRATADQLCLKARKQNPSMMQLIRNLQFGKSYLVQQPRADAQIHVRDMSVEELENHLVNLHKSGGSTRATLRSLLSHYCKSRNLEKLKICLKELDDQGFSFTPSAYALMIEAYLSVGDLEEASKLKTRLDNDFPDYKLDALKVLAYATLLIQNGRFEEAKELIKNDCAQMVIQVREQALNGVIMRLLSVAADAKNVAFVKEMHNLIMATFSFPSINPSYLQPLIKVHLNMGNLDLAIEEYKHCIMTYNMFPCRNLLFRTCIERNDNERLQQVVDVTMKHNQNAGALHELALVFIECGQLQQAYKVIQQLGERASGRYLSAICIRLFKAEKVTELEQLLHITKGLFHIDRNELYFHLLQLYAINNDCEKALELWNLLQEENVQPSVKTLRLLANLLESNNQPVPFVVPIGRTDLKAEVSELKPVVAGEDSLLSDLTKHLEQQEIGKVTEALQQMRKGHIRLLSVDSMRKIIDLHAVNDRLTDISSIVQVMSYIIEKPNLIVKPLLQRYAESGNIKMMMLMYNFLPEFTQKSMNFNYFLAKAFMTAGKEEELIKLLETNVGKNIRFFSTSGIHELLQSAPHLEDRFAKLVDVYSTEENFDLPKRVLWLHYFVNGKDNKAEEIFKHNKVMFNNFDPMAMHIIKAIRNGQNVDLGRKFIDFLDKYEVKDVVRNRAFSCVFDVLMDKNILQEAAEFVKTAQDRKIPLNCFNQASLIHLQNSFKQQGQTLPFALPVDDSSSSSDSDA